MQHALFLLLCVLCFVFFCCWTSFSHINNRCRPQDSNLCSYIVASFWNLEPIGRKGRGRTVLNVSKCSNQENHNATTWSDPWLNMLNSLAETHRIVTNRGGLLEHKHFARMLFKGGGGVLLLSLVFSHGLFCGLPPHFERGWTRFTLYITPFGLGHFKEVLNYNLFITFQSNLWMIFYCIFFRLIKKQLHCFQIAIFLPLS